MCLVSEDIISNANLQEVIRGGFKGEQNKNNRRTQNDSLETGLNNRELNEKQEWMKKKKEEDLQTDDGSRERKKKRRQWKKDEEVELEEQAEE